MQILLGINETIVKINSSATKIDYIQHFINTHFIDSSIKDNSIYIPQSYENQYHRIFLLKWLYTLYSKKTDNIVPELKELLVKRYDKPIKIVLKEKIIHKLFYKIVNSQTINIQITPSNSHIAYTLKKYFQSELVLLSTSMNFILESQAKRVLLKELLCSENFINVPHEHIYSIEDINLFCTPKNEDYVELSTYVSEACNVFGLTSDFDIKSLKKQYKRLAKEFHPDRVSDKSENNIDLYTRKFQNILSAYEVLLIHVAS